MNKIIKNVNQRIAVLVDVQNLYYSGKNLFSSRVNFQNLLKQATADRVLIRSIAYVIKSDEKESDFFDAVNKSGFEIKVKGIQVFPDGSKKGDWDIGITMDAVRLAEKVDSIVLISGDGDYIPVVTYIQQRFGCLVEVIAFEQTCSSALKEVADDFIAIEDYRKELLFKTPNSISTGNAAQKKIEQKKQDRQRKSSSTPKKRTSQKSSVPNKANRNNPNNPSYSSGAKQDKVASTTKKKATKKPASRKKVSTKKDTVVENVKKSKKSRLSRLFK